MIEEAENEGRASVRVSKKRLSAMQRRSSAKRLISMMQVAKLREQHEKQEQNGKQPQGEQDDVAPTPLAGERVRIANVNSMPEFNGQGGVVTGMTEDGRVRVTLDVAHEGRRNITLPRKNVTPEAATQAGGQEGGVQQKSAPAPNARKRRPSLNRKRSGTRTLDQKDLKALQDAAGKKCAADELPPGWIASASRSRPGETVYKNAFTGEKVPVMILQRTFVD